MRYKKLFEAKNDNLHEMPPDHLHAETATMLKSYGYERNAWTKEGNIITHRYSKTIHQEHVDDLIDDEQKIKRTLKKTGWKATKPDANWEGFHHPNGAFLSYDYNDRIRDHYQLNFHLKL